MIQEAKEHEAEDKKTKECIEKRNKLNGIILEVEKTIRENREKLEKTAITTAEQAIEKSKANPQKTS